MRSSRRNHSPANGPAVQQLSENEIVERYGALLETGLPGWRQLQGYPETLMLYPDSLLPASRTEIESAILQMGRRLSANGQLDDESLNIMRHCWGALANFIPAESVARAQAFHRALADRRYDDIAADNGESLALDSKALEQSRMRMKEFDRTFHGSPHQS
jgi:hypothetical protein